MAVVKGNNCYVSLDEAESYFAERIDTDAWDTATAPDKEKALITATMLIDDKFIFIGAVSLATQPLSWPRMGVAYRDPQRGTYEQPDSQTVPYRVSRSVLEQALHLLLNEGILDTQPQTFEKIRIGSIQLEDSASDYKPAELVAPIVNTLLLPLLVSNGSSMWWRAN
jgi:hypothetical protein